MIEQWLRVSSGILGLCFIGVAFALVYIGNVVDNALFLYGAFIVPEEFANSCRAMVLLGLSLFAVLLLQIFGTIRQWAFFMFLHGTLLAYLVLVGLFALRYTQKDEVRLESQLFFGMLVSLKRFGEDSEQAKEFRMGWTSLQLQGDCCGTNNYTDWEDVRMLPYDPQVPISCCRHRVAFCSDSVTFRNVTEDSRMIFTQGCYAKAKEGVSLHQIWPVLIPFVALGALSVLNSCYLAWKWKRPSSRQLIPTTND